MAKEKAPSAVTRLTAEELGKLTQEELVAYASKLAAEAADLVTANKQLEDAAHNLKTDLNAVKSDNLNLQTDLKTLKDENADKSSDIKSLKAGLEKKESELRAVKQKEKASKPVSFEVESEDGKSTHVYEFTAPALTWDDNQVYLVRQLSESKEKADRDLFDEICAKLIQRSSGLVRLLRKED